MFFKSTPATLKHWLCSSRYSTSIVSVPSCSSWSFSLAALPPPCCAWPEQCRPIPCYSRGGGVYMFSSVTSTLSSSIPSVDRSLEGHIMGGRLGAHA